ncbi:MAG: glycosyltransferase family 1 protein [Candidatus Paceibacterota bacterium]
MNKLRLAIDGNEANVTNRVGSNVYAFEVLKQLYQLTTNKRRFDCTILLSQPAVDDLPKARSNWQYRVIKPARFWTQWALPLHLFWQQKNYDVLFTPSHYAPRLSPVPYVSSVMDLAFLKFPNQFTKHDLFQLKHWTAYSVKRAHKIITISQFSKDAIHDTYQKSLQDIVVAPPAVSESGKYSPLRWKAFLRKHGIEKNNYFLYLGTLQPRKNLLTLIESFEAFYRSQAAAQLKKRTSKSAPANLPQLVIAGKIGWLADELQKRAEQSAIQEKIIFTGFVNEELKKPLYENAIATLLIGLYEGFGIPPLESLSVGTLPIVSNTTSLPEVVGNAGLTVDPTDQTAIANALEIAWRTPPSKRQQLVRKMRKQTKKFSWKKTGKIILKTIQSVAKHDSN